MKIIIKLIITLTILSNVSFAQFNFDSVQVKKIRLIIEERDFLKVENDSLISRCKLFDKKISLLNLEIEMQDTIISYKEKQIKLLESKPIEVREIKTHWYTWAGVIVSSIATGLIIGVIIK
jgi:hypothetical protein